MQATDTQSAPSQLTLSPAQRTLLISLRRVLLSAVKLVEDMLEASKAPGAQAPGARPPAHQ